MKKFIAIIVLFVSVCINASANITDTIPANENLITKVIVDTTINTKGNPVVRHYFVYDGELIYTSKSTYDFYMLCKKHDIVCLLSIIRKGNNKRIILRK